MGGPDNVIAGTVGSLRSCKKGIKNGDPIPVITGIGGVGHAVVKNSSSEALKNVSKYTGAVAKYASILNATDNIYKADNKGKEAAVQGISYLAMKTAGNITAPAIAETALKVAELIPETKIPALLIAGGLQLAASYVGWELGETSSRAALNA